MYTRDTVISVQPFTRQVEGEDVIIGRVETGVFLAIPFEAVEVLDALAQGKTIGEVSDLYQQKYGEAPDLDDFLHELESKGIVGPRGQDESGAGATSKATVQLPRGWGGRWVP
jgi:hypothetical protein